MFILILLLFVVLFVCVCVFKCLNDGDDGDVKRGNLYIFWLFFDNKWIVFFGELLVFWCIVLLCDCWMVMGFGNNLWEYWVFKGLKVDNFWYWGYKLLVIVWVLFVFVVFEIKILIFGVLELIFFMECVLDFMFFFDIEWYFNVDLFFFVCFNIIFLELFLYRMLRFGCFIRGGWVLFLYLFVRGDELGRKILFRLLYVFFLCMFLCIEIILLFFIRIMDLLCLMMELFLVVLLVSLCSSLCVEELLVLFVLCVLLRLWSE